jgi:hypothetical protein
MVLDGFLKNSLIHEANIEKGSDHMMTIHGAQMMGMTLFFIGCFLGYMVGKAS